MKYLALSILAAIGSISVLALFHIDFGLAMVPESKMFSYQPSTLQEINGKQVLVMSDKQIEDFYTKIKDKVCISHDGIILDGSANIFIAPTAFHLINECVLQ